MRDSGSKGTLGISFSSCLCFKQCRCLVHLGDNVHVKRTALYADAALDAFVMIDDSAIVGPVDSNCIHRTNRNAVRACDTSGGIYSHSRYNQTIQGAEDLPVGSSATFGAPHHAYP